MNTKVILAQMVSLFLLSACSGNVKISTEQTKEQKKQ